MLRAATFTTDEEVLLDFDLLLFLLFAMRDRLFIGGLAREDEEETPKESLLFAPSSSSLLEWSKNTESVSSREDRLCST